MPAQTFNQCPQRASDHRREQLKEDFMGIGVSLILIAVGAILTWAVNATVSGLDINTIGVILMIVGAIGLVLSLLFWSTWGGVGGTRRRTSYVEDAPPPGY
jgi:uncharacterized YccA/Bax inhibitor family protein